MHVAEANAQAIVSGEDGDKGSLKDPAAFAMSTETLSRDYPLYASSLFNLIKTSEDRISKSTQDDA